MRKIKMFFMLALSGIMITSTITLAGTKGYVTRANGNYSIDCYISCSSDKGVGKTKGAPYGKYNRAVIIIYNSNGVALGNDTKHGSQEAVASKSKTGEVYSALSCHLVTNSSYKPEEELYKQVQMSEKR